MKFGKNTWIWGMASIALAALLTWALWPEYGSGYSEAQRRNWNGMIALTPMSDRQARSFVLGEMEKLASKEAPEWMLDIPKSFGDLPLEGLQIPYLKKMAKEGNGDASLELAFRAESNNSYHHSHFSFSSIDSLYQLETYLSMAAKQGREGAEFLWCLFEYRKKGGDDEGVKNLEGYQSFLAKMDNGDFALGKVYIYLAPNGEEALSRLAIGLRKKANKGDVTALRDSAYLALLRSYQCRYDDLRDVISFSNTVELSSVTSSITDFKDMLQQWMPNSSSLFDRTEKAMLDWLEKFKWDRDLRPLERPLGLLGEAAEKGDIHAKYLWVKYSETIKRYFSKDDWELHLKCVDELLKRGGVYSEIFRGSSDFSYSANAPLPEWSFYKADSFRRIKRDSNERINREYAEIFPCAVNFKMLRMNVRASIQMEYFTDDLYSDEFFGDKKKHKDQQASIQLLEKAAAKGDPLAIFNLSRILSDYGEREDDGFRAWQLLEKFKIWKENVCGYVKKDKIQYSESSENSWYSSGILSDDFIEIQKVNIVSLHGDMPGMTVEEAFDQFLEDSAKRLYRGKQKETLKVQFEKRGFKIPEDKK